MDFKELQLAAQKIYESTIPESCEYPNSNDKLFTDSEEFWPLNACIHKSNGIAPHAAGYLDGAKLLARIVIFTQSHMDTLMYPIIYLYRHYVEIMLKALIRRGAYVTGLEINPGLEKVLGSHNLMKLWESFKPLFEEISGSNSDFISVKEGIESYIHQIHDIDPGSLAFRYDRTKDTKRHNLEKFERINILHFCHNMEKLTTLFEGIDAEFDAALEYANEMRSHCAP